MNLAPGTLLLHYRLVDKLGEGGMGVVWKARDTTLDRDVAIKLLPPTFATDPERMTRFEREAKTLAALNHPHVAAVYGLHSAPIEDVAEPVRFIAMELVPGEDLAQRLARGPLPLDEAIDVARKIALGMSAAHESGTIHRDLKPANVRITPTEDVKVLDFGLARGGEPGGGADVANSPTLTSAGTVTGVLLGTVAYMSPEQARGRAVDRRADVWAFGCVLWECLTGGRAFGGETMSEILAEVLKSEPDWAQLPAATPAGVRRLLRRCLAKNPDERLRDLGDAALELTDLDDEPTEAPTPAEAIAATRGGPSRVAMALLAAVTLVFGFAAGSLWMRGDPSGTGANDAVAERPTAGIVALPNSARVAYGAAPIGYDSSMLTLSADGRYVAYVGRGADGSQLFVHDLTGFAVPRAIPGTVGALEATFSPQEPSLAFLTNDRLARVDITGDRLQTLGDVRSATRVVWGDDGNIYVGDSQATRLRRFPENGGDAEELGEMVYHGFSDVLPGGRAALFHEKNRGLMCNYATVSLYDLSSRESRVVLENAFDARYEAGRLFFIRNAELMAATFDPERGEVTGDPEVLLRDVAVDSIFGQSQVALSPSGSLAYLPGGDRALGTIAWVDRDGSRGRLDVEPQVYGTLDLSPDDRRLAVHVGAIRDYVWVYDMQRGTGRKLPSTASAGWPIWSTAGDQLAFSEITADTNRFVRRPAGSGDESTVVYTSDTHMIAYGWSPDDRLIGLNTEGNARIVSIDDGSVRAEIDGFMPSFSADGRWVVYGTQRGGVYETIVRSWPDEARSYSIQTEGGIEGLFVGNELFYRLGNRWFAVAMKTRGDELEWSAPELAFEISFLDTPGISYDVSSDGRRLYTIVQAHEDVEDRIHVIHGVEALRPPN